MLDGPSETEILGGKGGPGYDSRENNESAPTSLININTAVHTNPRPIKEQ